MMNRDLLKKDLKRLAAVLTFITNCFIISGVIHHWRPRSKDINVNNEWNNTYRYTHDNTELAAPLEEIAEIQQKATGYTSSKEAD